LESDVLTPMAAARLAPATASIRFAVQPKKVMTCLRQCCSPSVNLGLLVSAPSRTTKRPMLRTRPRAPCAIVSHVRSAGHVDGGLARRSRKKRARQGRMREKKRAAHKYHGASRERAQSGCVKVFWSRKLPVSRNQETDMVAGVHAGHVEARHVGPAKRAPVPRGVIYVRDGRAGDEAQVAKDAQHVRQLPRAVVGSIHVGGGLGVAGDYGSDVGRWSKLRSEGRDETITLFGRRRDAGQLGVMLGSGEVALGSGGLGGICHG
jgi:hypothetical protein